MHKAVYWRVPVLVLRCHQGALWSQQVNWVTCYREVEESLQLSTGPMDPLLTCNTTHTDRDTETHTQTETQRHTHRQRDRDTHRMYTGGQEEELTHLRVTGQFLTFTCVWFWLHIAPPVLHASSGPRVVFVWIAVVHCVALRRFNTTFTWVCVFSSNPSFWWLRIIPRLYWHFVSCSHRVWWLLLLPDQLSILWRNLLLLPDQPSIPWRNLLLLLLLLLLHHSYR